jgi:hypothetical protein
MSNLLNRTAASGVLLTALIDHRNGICRVGKGLSRDNLNVEPVELLSGAKGASVFLFASHRLVWDQEQQYLASYDSAFRLYADADFLEPLLRYEYVRDNSPHPEAHIHVHAEWTCTAPMLGTSPPRKLHLPVGGRRFRPSLEDLIEFLINEGFTAGKPAWQQAIADHREEWMALQLKAAVRRSPGIALEVLREMGEI